MVRRVGQLRRRWDAGGRSASAPAAVRTSSPARENIHLSKADGEEKTSSLRCWLAGHGHGHKKEDEKGGNEGEAKAMKPRKKIHDLTGALPSVHHPPLPPCLMPMASRRRCSIGIAPALDIMRGPFRAAHHASSGKRAGVSSVGVTAEGPLDFNTLNGYMMRLLQARLTLRPCADV